MAASDVIVVGAGAIGSAVAWRCAQRGLTVTLLDPHPEQGAWHTAAGMLAPITELQYTETPLLRLNLVSAARYPDFAAEVSDESGLPTGFRACGTVFAAWDGADLATLRDHAAFATSLGLPADLLTGRELHELEPALAAGLPGGLHASGDHQVDPRLLHAALLEAARRRGVRLVRARASLVANDERVRGVLTGDGTKFAAGCVVLAAGCWSATVAGVPRAGRPPVRPVKGQTVRLRLPETPVNRVVRGWVRGTACYVVPRGDGRLVVGASVEEAGFDQQPRAGAVYELLRDAQALLPELGEAALDEVCTGLRPGSPDNAPIVGPTGVAGLLHATGHYRNGILLTPVTADGIAAAITDGRLPNELVPFTATRFAGAAA